MNNKIKIVFFSDSHLGFDYPIMPKIEIRRRGRDFFDNHERVLQYALDNNADLVIHGGDYFFRTKIPKMIEAIAYDNLLRFAEKGIPIFIVPGNHESSRLPGSLLTQHKNINIFSKPESFRMNIRGISIDIYGFPFVRGNIRDGFHSVLNQIPKPENEADVNLLCIHQTVEGSVVGPSDYTFRHNEDVIQRIDLPAGYDCFLSGHIHRRQVLYTNINGKEIPFIYPGSIERTSFAEKDEVKGFYVLEFDKKSNEVGISKMEFIKLPARPMIDLELNGSAANNEDLCNKLKVMFSSVDKDAIVRLACKDMQTKMMLNAQLLRDAAPKTMNVQTRGGFRAGMSP